MAEPTSSAAAAATATAGVGLAALLPWIDANALMGAVLGAGLVAYSKSDISPLKRIGALAFSAALGYLMSGEVINLTPVQESGTGGFIGAIVIVPLALKLLDHIEQANASELLKKWRGQ
ncbi:putative holin [Oceanimonas pelagia]|uniref:Holin n=1 Tax=Oceanimonas pelagia TaxID=3028314 RepID=A0AA50QD31_9GAMM|nr:putative holin [Oceanimonas pelagia]WMC11756.1 putative holin [Oceanimonas pelagia]